MQQQPSPSRPLISTLQGKGDVPWDAWVGDYSLVRTAIENTYPDKFGDFNDRLFTPGGFWKGNPAAHRKWETKSGKAEFNVPRALNSTGFQDKEGRFRLVTLRSNDQFNTTVYGYDDRFRGIKGTRDVVLMGAADMARAGVREGDTVTLVGDAEDGVDRRVGNLRVVPYDLPEGWGGKEEKGHDVGQVEDGGEHDLPVPAVGERAVEDQANTAGRDADTELDVQCQNVSVRGRSRKQTHNGVNPSRAAPHLEVAWR